MDIDLSQSGVLQPMNKILHSSDSTQYIACIMLTCGAKLLLLLLFYHVRIFLTKINVVMRNALPSLNPFFPRAFHHSIVGVFTHNAENINGDRLVLIIYNLSPYQTS